MLSRRTFIKYLTTSRFFLSLRNAFGSTDEKGVMSIIPMHEYLSTGYENSDRLIKGYHPGELIVICGSIPPVKSDFLIKTVKHTLNVIKKPVVYFSCIFPGKILKDRLFGSEAEAPSLLSAFRLTIELKDVASKTKRLKREKGSLGLIVVHNIVLMCPEVYADTEKYEDAVALVLGSLKKLAINLKVPVVAVETFQKSTTLDSMLKGEEMAAIEPYADTIIVLTMEGENKEPKLGEKATVRATIAKSKHGQTGTLFFSFMYDHFHSEYIAIS
jgi:replicative DNA helicase